MLNENLLEILSFQNRKTLNQITLVCHLMHYLISASFKSTPYLLFEKLYYNGDCYSLTLEEHSIGPTFTNLDQIMADFSPIFIRMRKTLLQFTARSDDYENRLIVLSVLKHLWDGRELNITIGFFFHDRSQYEFAHIL